MPNRPHTISGFTIVRNAITLDYPLRESILSLLPLCDEVIVNCGDSTDATREVVEALARQHPEQIKVIHTVWTKDNQTGGFQLKAQTDRALAECTGDWCFYLQSDEVLHERDYGNVKEAIQRANALGDVDGILFRYVHFYGSYDYEIRGRNWYRNEVRAFKNHRHISAFRDAQGFRRDGERLVVIDSGARVFHYGYVRSPVSLRTKSQEMSRWWGETPPDHADAFQLRNHFGLRRYDENHPALMRERIESRAPDFDPRQCARVWNKDEVKNLVTLAWESIFPYRIGEFRNYELHPASPR